MQNFLCRLNYPGCGEMVRCDRFPVARPWQMTMPMSLISCKVISVGLNHLHDYDVEREISNISYIKAQD